MMQGRNKKKVELMWFVESGLSLLGKNMVCSLLVNFITVPYKIKALERNEIEINETFTDSTVQKKYRFNAVLDQDAS